MTTISEYAPLITQLAARNDLKRVSEPTFVSTGKTTYYLVVVKYGFNSTETMKFEDSDLGWIEACKVVDHLRRQIE